MIDIVNGLTIFRLLVVTLEAQLTHHELLSNQKYCLAVHDVLPSTEW